MLSCVLYSVVLMLVLGVFVAVLYIYWNGRCSLCSFLVLLCCVSLFMLCVSLALATAVFVGLLCCS